MLANALKGVGSLIVYMEAAVEAAVAYASKQLRHHTEAVFQAGIIIELQGRGATVEREVPVTVPYIPSWTSAPVTVGFVRLDCVVRFGAQVAALEVKRTVNGSYETQLQKYKEVIHHEWGLALVTPDNHVQWIRRPAK